MSFDENLYNINFPLEKIDPSAYHKYIDQKLILNKKSLLTPSFDVNFEEWDGCLEKRRIDINFNGLNLECFSTINKKDNIFVFLSSGANRRGPIRTNFERVSWHPWFDGICINIEDPTRCWLSSDVTVGWYFGSKTTHALAAILEVIKKIQNKYSIKNKKVRFIGSSSGGFAALWLASKLHGAIAYAGNPQFYASLWPSSIYFSPVGVDINSTEYIDRFVISDLTKVKDSKFYIIVNSSSARDYQTQLMKFLKKIGVDKIFYGLNIIENLEIFCRNYLNLGALSPHHAFDNVHEFKILSSILESENSEESKREILNSLHEIQYDRYKNIDNIFYENHWKKIFSHPDFPWDFVSIFKKKSINNIYFLIKNSDVLISVRWGEQGKYAKITAHSTQHTAHSTQHTADQLKHERTHEIQNERIAMNKVHNKSFIDCFCKLVKHFV